MTTKTTTKTKTKHTPAPQSETPILMEALAKIAQCTPADAAEHLAGTRSIAEFIDSYAPLGPIAA